MRKMRCQNVADVKRILREVTCGIFVAIPDLYFGRLFLLIFSDLLMIYAISN
jgi:hypothetical protein